VRATTATSPRTSRRLRATSIATSKLDLFAGYDVRSPAGNTSVQLGINNLFDATPPLVYNAAAASSDAATYNFIGRMIYLRIAQRF
jgi:outer membrane receptor protein involved in Fe transport